MLKIRRRYKKIHLDGSIWQYFVGQYSVVLYSPTGQKYVKECQKLAKVEDWSRAKRKGYGNIEPFMIVDWIKSLSQD